MDGISILDALLFYIVIFAPLLVMVLLVGWTVINLKHISKEQLPKITTVFGLQFVYYVLFFVFITLESNAILWVLCMIPIIAMLVLYPIVLGKQKLMNSRILLVAVFVVQAICMVSVIAVAIISLFN